MQSQASHHSKESGAIVGFIVVSLVLLGLLAGGFWFIKNRHDVAANTQTAVNEVKEEDKKPADDKPATSDDKKQNEQNGDSEPVGEPVAPRTDTQNQGSGSSNTPKPSATPEATPPSSVAHTGPSHIASTGPEDVLGNAFLLSSLVIVGHIYRQSRRHSA